MPDEQTTPETPVKLWRVSPGNGLADREYHAASADAAKALYAKREGVVLPESTKVTEVK